MKSKINTMLSFSEPAQRAQLAMQKARHAARERRELAVAGESRRFSNRAWAGALADAMGLDHLTTQAVSSWETGRVRVPAEALIAAAQLAGQSLDLLTQPDQKALASRLRAMADEIKRLHDELESASAKER